MLLSLTTTVIWAAELKIGLQPGDSVGPFEVVGEPPGGPHRPQAAEHEQHEQQRDASSQGDTSDGGDRGADEHGEAEEHHGQYEPTAPPHHWSDFYAAFLVARENGRTPEEAAEAGALRIAQKNAASA